MAQDHLREIVSPYPELRSFYICLIHLLYVFLSSDWLKILKKTSKQIIIGKLTNIQLEIYLTQDSWLQDTLYTQKLQKIFASLCCCSPHFAELQTNRPCLPVGNWRFIYFLTMPTLSQAILLFKLFGWLIGNTQCHWISSTISQLQYAPLLLHAVTMS